MSKHRANTLDPTDQRAFDTAIGLLVASFVVFFVCMMFLCYQAGVHHTQNGTYPCRIVQDSHRCDIGQW